MVKTLMHRAGLLSAACVLAASCAGKLTLVEQVSTSQDRQWQENTEMSAPLSSSIVLETGSEGQTVEGFGACFNELGWDALSLLDQKDREGLIRELFSDNGADFNICRMPVGANDFSRDWYSYNETEGDFEMKDFSISNDYETLIPFIYSALAVEPDLKIWASPWCPPSWMKRNKHYAMKPSAPRLAPQYRNDLPEEKTGKEGEDMFIVSDKYFKAYAKYFRKFIEAYKSEGIDIFAVMPQNEFNSVQPFPSCTWTPGALAEFVGGYLGPEMKECGVQVMLGTMERAKPELVHEYLSDKKAAEYTTGVGFQWAGKGAIEEIHAAYPQLKLFQTEQECGDSKNDWAGVLHSWDLMKHFFDNGVSAYMYWNIALKSGGVSRWGWAQNSLIVVDGKDDFHFTPEYYLLKHFSHYVKPGAKYIPLQSEGIEAVSFRNLDGKCVVVAFNKAKESTSCSISIDGKSRECTVPANSVSTMVFSL